VALLLFGGGAFAFFCNLPCCCNAKIGPAEQGDELRYSLACRGAASAITASHSRSGAPKCV
jgi:hypothetical protein